MFLVQRMFHSRISESNTVLSNGDSDMSSINIMYKCIFQEVSEQSNSQGFVHCHLENALFIYRDFYVAIIINFFVILQILFEKYIEFQFFGIRKLTIINLGKQ